MARQTDSSGREFTVTPEPRQLRAALIGILLPLLLTGCGGSNDDNNIAVDTTPVTVVPDSVDVIASAEAVGTSQEIDISAVTQYPGYRDMKITSMSTHADAPLLILHYFFQEASGSLDSYVGYDLNSGSFRTLKDEVDRSSSMDISRDGTAVAWLDGSSCALWYQSLEPLSSPLLINDLLQETSCPRPPRLNANGEIVLFDQAVGSYNANGVLAYNGFNRDLYDIAIVRPGTQEVLELAVNKHPLGDDALDSMSRSLAYQGSSHDGSRVIFKAFYLPRTLPEQGLPDYVVGTLLVDTLNGDASLLNRNRYQRFFGEKVPAGVQDDATLSGDGKVAWYVESDGITVDRELAPSLLQRRDLETGQITTIDIPGFKQSLHASDDGNRLAFQLDGELVVYRHDAGVLLHTDKALKFCTNPNDATDCEFESDRTVLGDPISISGDGSTALLQTIPMRSGITEPQNIMELFLLDIDTGTLQRVAPGNDILWMAMTSSSNQIAFQSDYSDDGSYLDATRLVMVSR